jgi:uncharacterized protein
MVVAGPVGAGKSTFIRSLAEGGFVETDEAASEDIGKAATTVALDFGTLEMDGLKLYLFGTPGQDRFDFVWEVLCEGAFGFVLLVSGEDPRQLSRARSILEFVTSRIPVPFLVGVTHQDRPRVWEPGDVADYFALPAAQVVGLDATSRPSCLSTVAALLEVILSARAMS